MANPPFAGGIKETRILAKYDLARSVSLSKNAWPWSGCTATYSSPHRHQDQRAFHPEMERQPDGRPAVPKNGRLPDFPCHHAQAEQGHLVGQNLPASTRAELKLDSSAWFYMLAPNRSCRHEYGRSMVQASD